MKIKNLFCLSAVALLSTLAAENVTVTPQAIPGTLKSNINQPSNGYRGTEVQAQLQVNIKDSENTVRFIRTNADPLVLTKIYQLKHAEPYAIRGYVLCAVQGTRISNNPVQVDAIKFADGKGVLLVSAEDYRFKNKGNGNSIDEIIEKLDKPGMGFSSGRPKFIYFPKLNTAANLREMVMNSGAAIKDFAFASGTDVITVDGNLNALFVASPHWSAVHIKEMLEKYDQPLPEVSLSYQLLEVSSENDDKIGADFQSWKNNNGVDLFSIGGRYRSNWANTFAGGMDGSHSSKTEFLNFNPKWNSRYLDFLTSTGRAKVVTQGVITAKNRRQSTISVASGLFYEQQTPIADTSINNRIAEKNEKLPPEADWTLLHGNAQDTRIANSFKFEFSVTPIVTQKASLLPVKVSGVSLQGWNSDGSPRLNVSSFAAEVHVGNNGKEFVIGGIKRSNLIRSVSGIPLLKDIPLLGWLFSSESETLRNSELVLIVRSELAPVAGSLPENIRQDTNDLKQKLQRSNDQPITNLGFEQLGLDSKSIE